MDSTNNGLQVQYKVGEWVEADPELYTLGYGLCVYNDPVQPLFAGDLLFEVEVEGILPELPKKHSCTSVTKEKLLDGTTTYAYFEEWPKGTVMVRAVKLVR